MKRRRLLASTVGAFAGVGVLGCHHSVAEPVVARGSGPNFYWIHDFAKTGDDDATMLQRAIDFVRDIAIRASDTSHLPALFLRAGRYDLAHTIETAPWIKLCSVGSVLFDFTHLAPDNDGFVCRNETSLPATLLRYPGDRSPFLDGTGGTISILGPGVDRSGGWGVVMGNRGTSFPGAVRDAGGRNVVISGWRGALRLDPINMYLSSWFSSRFEQNREEGIYASHSTALRAVNSGERLTFIDCAFAGSNCAVRVDSDSMDFVFDSCSFDFNGDVIKLDRGASSGTVSLHHCHVEGIDNLLVNATHAGDHLRVVIENSIVLPRYWKKKTLCNAPRLLVAGNTRFAASAVEWRFEALSIAPIVALIGDEVHVEHLSGQSFQRIAALPWRGSVRNADSDFQCDPLQTAADVLTHWTISGAKGKLARPSPSFSTLDAGARRQLLLLDVPPGKAPIELSTKTPFSVRSGEQLVAQCTIAGVAEVSIQYRFTDEAGNVMNARSFPNGDRKFPVVRATVPSGATRCQILLALTADGSALEVASAAVWGV
ncbi:hypothetical protein [Burkholderia sp. Ax-1719]|uniref:hypothetical protein n=1 Tax=Burkholderia sp. Ax-1719 TaxID=2608334 RepID=UPI00141FB0CC|nr:hypothetical protein [Burkholderia sp. Ax-1719]